MADSNFYLTVFQRLNKHYGSQNWWPIVVGEQSLYLPEYRTKERNEDEIFEIAVGAILTQNTAWINVEKALVNLKKIGPLNLNTLQKLDDDIIKKAIRPAGYYNQKLKKIRAFQTFIENQALRSLSDLKNSKILDARKGLLSIWGVGMETADSILLYALGKAVFVVDTYTRRLFSRLGKIPERADYDDIRLTLEKHLPQDIDLFREYHALIVRHAKEHCRKKALCQDCPLADICAFSAL